MIGAWLDELRPIIDAELERRVPDMPAMRYAALGAGKRLRPALALTACEAVGGDRSAALPAAAAIEMLHAYTLVHDDLPALDDDDERRGRPTVHVQYGEATAILAGDGLLTAAFGALADLGPRAADAVAVLAARSGADELIAGQVRDLAAAAAPSSLSIDDIEAIHRDKTGALFSAAAELGAIAGGGSADDRARLARYGIAVGIAFQYADDRDDGDFDEHAAEAKSRGEAYVAEAIELVSGYGEAAAPLSALAQWIGSRL